MHSSISKLALGTVQFGLDYGIANTKGKTSGDEIIKILKYAEGVGIDLLDTAFRYGNSEESLGNNDLKGFNVVSKFPAPDSGKDIRYYLTHSLEKLRLERLYGYLAHNPQILIDQPILWNELIELKELGKVEKVGYSLYSPSDLKKLLSIGMYPDIVQVPYNILDQRFEDDLIRLKSKGVEIHTRSAFLQGLFFIKSDTLDPFFYKLKPFLNQFQQTYKTDRQKASVLLNFCVSQSFIDKIVIGINDLEQLKENIESLSEYNNISFEIPKMEDALIMPVNWPKK